MNDLVYRLCEGDHPVEISLRPERNIEALRSCLKRGYVHVKFTDTRGGTELGVPVDQNLSRLEDAYSSSQDGSIRIAGALTLDYEKVRCVADIDLSTFAGKGHLERLQE